MKNIPFVLSISKKESVVMGHSVYSPSVTSLASVDPFFASLVLPAYRFTISLKDKGWAYWNCLEEEVRRTERRFLSSQHEGVAFITTAHLYGSFTIRDILFRPTPYAIYSFRIGAPNGFSSTSFAQQWFYQEPTPRFEALVANKGFSVSWSELDGLERNVHAYLRWNIPGQQHREFQCMTDDNYKQFRSIADHARGVLLFHCKTTDGQDDRLTKTRWVVAFLYVEVDGRDHMKMLLQKHELHNSVTGVTLPYPQGLLPPLWRKMTGTIGDAFNSWFHNSFRQDVLFPYSLLPRSLS